MTEFKADMAFKCHICKKIFMNNIEFMKHLSLHVENERVTAVDLVDLSQCKYCLKDFESNFTLQKHLDDDHYKSQSQYICKICNVTFPQATHLILHMQKVHVRAEMVSHVFYAAIQNHFCERKMKLLSSFTAVRLPSLRIPDLIPSRSRGSLYGTT